MSPMYLFKCQCGHETEMLLSIADRDKLIQCPKCYAKRMRRMVTAATLGKSKHNPQAILGDGRKISGDWD